MASLLAAPNSLMSVANMRHGFFSFVSMSLIYIGNRSGRKKNHWSAPLCNNPLSNRNPLILTVNDLPPKIRAIQLFILASTWKPSHSVQESRSSWNKSSSESPYRKLSLFAPVSPNFYCFQEAHQVETWCNLRQPDHKPNALVTAATPA